MSTTERSTTRVAIPFDEDALTGKISDVITALVAARVQAPEEYRDAVEIEVEAEPGYEGTASLGVKAFYLQPETDEEMNGRRWSEDNRARHRLECERRDYERLKAKFG